MGDLLKSSRSDLNNAVAALQEQERQGREKKPKLIVRGITYYKSDPVDEPDTEENCKYNFDLTIYIQRSQMEKFGKTLKNESSLLVTVVP